MALEFSKIELSQAQQRVDKMRIARSFEEFETAWKEFLLYLEKIWIKSERECQDFKAKFEPWQGKFKNLRRNDPLLSYLKNARDSEQHSIEQIVERQPGLLRRARFVNPNGGFVKKMVINSGELTEYEGDPLLVEFTPERAIVKSVTNSGRIYNPPINHRGKSLADPKDPIEIAYLGLKFYTQYLNDIEKLFFNCV